MIVHETKSSTVDRIHTRAHRVSTVPGADGIGIEPVSGYRGSAPVDEGVIASEVGSASDPSVFDFRSRASDAPEGTALEGASASDASVSGYRGSAPVDEGVIALDPFNAKESLQTSN